MAPLTLEHDVEIRRPVGDVFDFVSDLEHLPAWMAGVKRVSRSSPGPVGVGTTYRVVAKMLGRRVESTYEVTAYEPDTVVSVRMTSPLFGFDETYHFEAVDGERTVVQVGADVRPNGVLRLLGPLLRLAMQRQVQADHRRLRSTLQRRSAAKARTRVGRAAPPAPQDEEPQPGRDDDRGEGDPGE
jgi:uncharacterized membrane protein